MGRHPYPSVEGYLPFKFDKSDTNSSLIFDAGKGQSEATASQGQDRGEGRVPDRFSQPRGREVGEDSQEFGRSPSGVGELSLDDSINNLQPVEKQFRKVKSQGNLKFIFNKPSASLRQNRGLFYP